MLNYRKQSELDVSEEADCSVSILFTEDGIEYEITRKVTFKKKIDNSITLINNSVIATIEKIETNGNRVPLNFTIASDRLLIPKDLSGFFFFDGERISRLAKVDGKKEIKNAILNVLGISYLDYAHDHLKFIKKSYIDKEKRLLSKDGNEFTLGFQHTELENSIIEMEKSIKDKNLKIDDNNKEIERLDRIINGYNIEKVAEFENKSKFLENQIDKLEVSLKDVEKDIKKHIASNFKYYLLYNYTKDVNYILETKRKEGQLPSNIKETFIDDLLKKGVCICGTCLRKGTKEYENVFQLKENAGSNELDDAYYYLKNIIAICKEQYKSFYPNLDKLQYSRQDIKDKIYNGKEELKITIEELKSIDIQDISNATNAREILKCENKNLTKELVTLEIKLENDMKQKNDLEKK